jgi:hypothetical protein
MQVEVAPGVELRVARQAVLRRVEDATGTDERPDDGDPDPGDVADDTPAS